MTEEERVKRRERNRRYEARKQAETPIRLFESDGYPLRLKLQRILANVKYCRAHAHRERYAGRGIKCRITHDDLLFIWDRDGAEQMARPSIDRIDNDGHYERGNIRFRELYDNISDGTKVRDAIKAVDNHAANPSTKEPAA